MDLIDRKALLERMNEFAAFAVLYKPCMSKDDIVESVLKQAKETALRLVEEAPIVKAIPFDSEYIKQILWERNIALQQLAEIGCGFGQDMTDIKKKIEAAPVVHGKLKLGNAVDVLFSHNEIVALWHEQGEERGIKYLLWRGMAWDIPKQYKTMPVVRFFGTIPQNFSESDTINIIIELPECGAKMDGKAV